MARVASRLRGLAQRAGTTVMILAVALVATAAAAAGPNLLPGVEDLGPG